MRVLHLPTDVGGNAWNLSRGERQLGFSSDVFVTSASRFNYRHDILLKTSSIPGFNLLSAMKAFYSFHKKYDVFHFNCGTTLIDIPSLRIANAELAFYSKRKNYSLHTMAVTPGCASGKSVLKKDLKKPIWLN